MMAMIRRTPMGHIQSVTDPWINIDGRLLAPVKPAQFAGLLNIYHPVGTSDGRYLWPSLTSKQPSTGNLMQPPFHVPGVDYAVGIRPSALPLKDPQTITDPNVTVNPTSIRITGNNVTLQGYDFSLAGGYDVNPQAANTTFLDCNFKVGTNDKICIYANGGSPSGLKVMYCEMDGSFTDTTPSTLIGNNGPDLTLRYCLIQNSNGDMINSDFGGAIDIRYCVIKDNGTTGSHPDVLAIGSQNYGPNVFNFNLIYQTNNPSVTGGSQGVFWDGILTWSLVQTTESAYNVIISLNPGAAAMGPWFDVFSTNLAAGATASVHDNYGDPTTTSPGWGFATSLTYAYPASIVYNNINMLDGTFFPST
jgi:hypothetical protein